MNQKLHADALEIINEAIDAVQPDAAVKRALFQIKQDREKKAQSGHCKRSGNTYLVAIGKAAWKMALVASSTLDECLAEGIVITKYDHVQGDIPGIRCFEAGHPVPDQNSFSATEQAIHMVEKLHAEDTVLFLVSGGGSALFEKPLVSQWELESITKQLLECGADIVEINTIRKRLSGVKGGKFAEICYPAHVYSIILSDIVGDPVDMIASGPAYPDSSTCKQALEIVKKYRIQISQEAEELMQTETPKSLSNVTTIVTGSVRELCSAAAGACRRLGYQPVELTTELCCQAKEAGSFLGTIGKTHSKDRKKLAYIAGGETVVKITGNGMGGRNQELALAAAKQIEGISNVAVFSIGSDGTDGPTDAAGGYVDGMTMNCLKNVGVDIEEMLSNNDAYNGLKICGGLIKTGPTGTNVNDVSVVLVDE